MSTNEFGSCLSVMEMLRFAGGGTEEPETGRVTVHVTSCDLCRQTVTEVITWLNARDEERASILAAIAVSREASSSAHRPLVMYSDELESARPAIALNPDAPMVAEGIERHFSGQLPPDLAARMQADQSWRDDFVRRVTPPAAAPSPSPDRDSGKEDSILKTMK